MSADAHTTPDTTNLIPLRPTDTPTTGAAPLLTPRRQAEFCRALAGHGNVRLACRAVAVSPQTAYRARRASAAFRACWDAATVIAREHVEQVLADRALNGVEESVFYHGEEVATRRRYDSRLLLAHLARLDRKAEDLATCSTCDAPLLGEHEFDAAVDALGEGPRTQDGATPNDDRANSSPGQKTPGQKTPGQKTPGQCSMCSTLAREAAPEASRKTPEPCPDCGGQCAAAATDSRVVLGPDDCEWFGNRLERMFDARPRGAPLPHQLATPEADAGAIEMRQLEAFEAGHPQWWLVTTMGQVVEAYAREETAQ